MFIAVNQWLTTVKGRLLGNYISRISNKAAEDKIDFALSWWYAHVAVYLGREIQLLPRQHLSLLLLWEESKVNPTDRLHRFIFLCQWFYLSLHFVFVDFITRATRKVPSIWNQPMAHWRCSAHILWSSGLCDKTQCTGQQGFELLGWPSLNERLSKHRGLPEGSELVHNQYAWPQIKSFLFPRTISICKAPPSLNQKRKKIRVIWHI